MTEDRDLFGEPVAPPLVLARVNAPPWYRVSKRGLASQRRMVLGGRHPFGSPLSEVPGALCGNCAFLTYHARVGKWWKCRLMNWTNGRATDLRVKWRACSAWTVAPPDVRVPRRRPA